MNYPIQPQEILSDRYQVIRELGQGGFGRTYLASDRNRFNERCVLKEFAPKIGGTYALQKAEELFAREAGVLYKLQHPQIPNFRELFQVKENGQGRLFLVQDYVEGVTYRDLLKMRLQEGRRFSEEEVISFLLQILPVLDYIHSQGVIHRDISPDNLMLRAWDQLPILIDFGGVKQVVVTVESQFLASEENPQPVPLATRLGKIGYAPHEQMQQGIVSASSDLYALGATALVLLTGKEPQQLIDPQTLNWNWRSEIRVSPKLARVLDKMLAQQPAHRISSATEVLELLQDRPSPSPQPNTEATVAVASPPVSASVDPTENTAPSRVIVPSRTLNPWLSGLGKVFLVLGGIAIAGVIGWLAGNAWIQSHLEELDSDRPRVSFPPITSDDEPDPPSRFSLEERERRETLRQRRQELGIDYRYYISLVNEAFWNQYPEQRGKILTDEPTDLEWRKRWDAIAAEWLEKLTFLSTEARSGLGSYDQATRDRWKQQVNRLRLSSRSLYDLVDAKFFYNFPDLEGQDFINKPIGQVWNALIFEQLQALRLEKGLQRIVFPEGEVGDTLFGTLQPGEGQAYIAQLSENQEIEIELETEQPALFSAYSPTGSYRFLEDSTERRWSGTLPETGFYEFTIVSKANTPLNYKFKIVVEEPPEVEDQEQL